uniref:F-box domain-containing protein n=1 Tax=Quercus lobata TaxID=97700 RepID=A0A7N2LEL6_QUELO
MTEYLRYDVLLEILHRLPLKSLIRFRCVSKSWNSLITKGYELIHEEDNNSSSEKIQELEFPNNFRRNFQVVGFVKGLFCLYEQSRYIVWNPCIKKSIALPNPSVATSFPCYLAFGFDSRINDYKLLRIAFQSKNISSKKPLVEVYSVNEGSWRITSGGDSYPPRVYISNRSLSTAVSLNGAVYFAAYHIHSDARVSIVLSFDLGDEVFRVISLPNEYGVVDSWTKLFTIDLNRQLCGVLGFRKNGHLLLQKEVLLGWELCTYDPESQQVKNLGLCRSSCYSFADNYVENLFLLDKPNDAVSKWNVSKKRKCR